MDLERTPGRSIGPVDLLDFLDLSLDEVPVLGFVRKLDQEQMRFEAIGVDLDRLLQESFGQSKIIQAADFQSQRQEQSATVIS